MKKGGQMMAGTKRIGTLLKKLGEEIENEGTGGNMFDSFARSIEDKIKGAVLDPNNWRNGKIGGMMLAGDDEARMIRAPKRTEDEEKKIKKSVIDRINKQMSENYGKSLLDTSSDEDEGGNAPAGQLDMIRGGYKAVIYDDIHEYGSGKRKINKKASDALKYFQSELKKYRETHPNTPYRECQKIISQKLKK
jgi:hypothetical protein